MADQTQGVPYSLFQDFPLRDLPAAFKPGEELKKQVHLNTSDVAAAKMDQGPYLFNEPSLPGEPCSANSSFCDAYTTSKLVGSAGTACGRNRVSSPSSELDSAQSIVASSVSSCSGRRSPGLSFGFGPCQPSMSPSSCSGEACNNHARNGGRQVRCSESGRPLIQLQSLGSYSFTPSIYEDKAVPASRSNSTASMKSSDSCSGNNSPIPVGHGSTSGSSCKALSLLSGDLAYSGKAADGITAVSSSDVMLAKLLTAVADSTAGNPALMLQNLLGFAAEDYTDLLNALSESGCSYVDIIAAYLHNIRIMAEDAAADPAAVSESMQRSISDRYIGLLTDVIKATLQPNSHRAGSIPGPSANTTSHSNHSYNGRAPSNNHRGSRGNRGGQQSKGNSAHARSIPTASAALSSSSSTQGSLALLQTLLNMKNQAAPSSTYRQPKIQPGKQQQQQLSPQNSLVNQLQAILKASSAPKPSVAQGMLHSQHSKSSSNASGLNYSTLELLGQLITAGNNCSAKDAAMAKVLKDIYGQAPAPPPTPSNQDAAAASAVLLQQLSNNMKGLQTGAANQLPGHAAACDLTANHTLELAKLLQAPQACFGGAVGGVLPGIQVFDQQHAGGVDAAQMYRQLVGVDSMILPQPSTMLTGAYTAWGL